MVRTQIQLTEEQAKALRKIAITSHLSVAELIRRAVKDNRDSAYYLVDSGVIEY